MGREKTVIASDRGEAFKKALINGMLAAVGAWLCYLGAVGDGWWYLLIGGFVFLNFFYFFCQYIRYVFVTKVFFILDDEGIRTDQDFLLVPWGAVEGISYVRKKQVYMVVHNQGSDLYFATGNVVSMSKLQAALHAHANAEHFGS